MARGDVEMRKLYSYVIEGSGANNQTWQTRGAVLCEFHDAFDHAMLESFDQLTQGKAIYGNPGVGSCKGPYDILKVTITQVAQ
jgi:hypothetical protein